MKKIIAFDGNVYTGKTTIINQLSSLNNSLIIEEYEVMDQNVSLDSAEDFLNLQLLYLDQELKRKKLLNESESDFIYIDRSFFSLSAHVYAIKKIRNIDIRKPFLSKLNYFIENCMIEIPLFFCFLTCPETVIKKRYEKGESLLRRKNTPSIYVSENYLKAIEEFCEFINVILGEEFSFKLESSNVAFCTKIIEKKICCIPNQKLKGSKITNAISQIFQLGEE